MVEFSTHENLLSKLTLVDATTRKNLELKVPTKGQGETCIGCGVRLALQELGNRNGTMVLVADGQNTVPDQFISDVQADVVQSGTKVISVGFGDMAPVDDMRQLAKASGGLFVCVSDEDGVQGLLEAFKEALKLAKPQVEKTTQMTENWTTEDTRLPTDLPVSSTLSGQQHTTVHQNFTNSHVVPGKPQTMPLLWLIIGIVMAVVGGAILLAFTILLIRKICAITHARGTYSVVKRNHETA
ncbi:Calcium-activated chloride channel regulator 1 [Zootermopsis nevadensis]|uniref:Calcium-activated chloride channel regulator 1 n=2 Tax=Zootermopsis nevadensis TaxID=136037 RepID=A0A067QX07_ZOONE|nr:Calcium-activated chloride channel regulator 1 [Zootermopsis nevadensis]